MEAQAHAEIAVLLATHNGEKFIDQQIESLKHNRYRFTLHWLDDHSSDGTQELVKASSARYGVNLVEWNHPEHQGYPGCFFQLLECVEADIYMFCDQDDIWQPGKIDTTVDSLVADLARPVLCFSDPLVFMNEKPDVLYRLSKVIGISITKALEETRVFVHTPAWGHTIGFTRPLRETFLENKNIARTHSFGHDWWMYMLAVFSGSIHLLQDAPTTLFRRHGGNVTGLSINSQGKGQVVLNWRIQQDARRCIAKQAAGFVMVLERHVRSPRAERLLALGRLMATLNRRQSPAAIVRLLRLGALWPNSRISIRIVVTCLISDAGS